MAERIFNRGDPGMPMNGLLVGSGGGFTWRYADFVLHADGKIEKIEYETSEGSIPDNYQVTARGSGSADEISDLDAKLVANGFWSMKDKPPASNDLEYIVAVSEKKGAHSLVWSRGSPEAPETISSLRKDILEYARKVLRV